MLYSCEQSGVWISNTRIDDAIIRYGPYLVDGQFSEERYRSTSNAERLATRKYFREQLLHSQYLVDQAGSQLQSRQESEFFKSMYSPERSFRFVSLSFDDYPREEVLGFARENEQMFAMVKLSRILVKSSEKEAQEILKKLNQNISSFEELAKAHSKDTFAEKGGDMGWRYFYDLEGDFGSQEQLREVFDLKEGALSDVIEGNFGWMLFRCDAEAISPDLTDQETLDRVESYMMRYERGKVEDYFWGRAEAFQRVAAQKGFFKACEEMSLVPYDTTYFPINYQGIFFIKPVTSTSENVNISSASYSEDFFLEAFALADDEISNPVILNDQILVLTLRGTQDPPEEETQVVESYYQYLVGQAIDRDIEATLMDSDRLVDNFTEVFYQYFLPQS